MKAFLEIGGASLTLIGVVVGVYGTYLMTKFYHPYGPLGFTKSIVKMLWRTLFFQSERAKRHNEVAAKFAKLREEDKGESLAGVHWLFVGSCCKLRERCS